MDATETDTSETFTAVFGTRTEFDSWDEFTTYMEEFQRKSGSSFKLKSASSVDYINERRVHDFIPERFVYAKVKMICIHFGLPTIRGAGHRKDYVGKGCGAFINVGYNRGALKITQTQLKHINHPLGQEGESLPLRQFRVFNFTDELDLIIAREVLNQNPFEYINGDKKWSQVIKNLRESDDRLTDISARVVKRRIRILIDKFLTISNGNPPVEKDEMGNILYKLERTRSETLNNSANRGKGNKRNSSSYLEDNDDFYDDEDFSEETSPGKGRTDAQNHHGTERRSERPQRSRQKRKFTYDADDFQDGLSSDNDLDTVKSAKKKAPAPSVRGRGRRGRPSKRIVPSPHADGSGDNVSARKRFHSSSSGADLDSLMKYLQFKDQQERKLRQQEIDLRKEEIALLKKNMELHRQQLEMDKVERKALLEFLRAQSQPVDSLALSSNHTSHCPTTDLSSQSPSVDSHALSSNHTSHGPTAESSGQMQNYSTLADNK